MTEGIVYGIKVGLATASALVFFTAINVLVGFVLTYLPNSPGGILLELFRMLSVCLPFDPVVVFLAVSEVMGAIISFLIAQQIYKITMTTYNAS